MESRIKSIFVIILILFPFSFVHQSKAQLTDETYYQSEIERTPIRFWRADSDRFPVVESNVFPMVSLGGSGGFKNLGKAWITWTVEINDRFLPIWAIFNRGNIEQFRIVEGFYESVSWFWVQSELFLITTSSAQTKFFWFSLTQENQVFNLDFKSSNHKIYLTQDDFKIYFNKDDGTSAFIDLKNISLEVEETDDVVIDTLIGIGGIFKISNGSITIRTNDFQRVVPDIFSNNSVLGHYELNPTIFDRTIEKAWELGSNDTINLPKNIDRIFPIGMRSSLILTLNGSLYEISSFGTELIDVFPSDWAIDSVSLIDIDLYLSTTHGDGLFLFASGQDTDGDTIPDMMEEYFLTFSNDQDSDDDSIPDNIEIAYGTAPNYDDRLLDTDGDGINNIQEYNLFYDPGYEDTDFGGAGDGYELKYGFNPLDKSDDGKDSDADGVSNAIESNWGSNPLVKDTDNDGMPDGWEIQYGFNPLDPSNALLDYDNDGKNNLLEYKSGSDPLVPDPPEIYDGLMMYIFLFMISLIPLTLYFWKEYFTERIV